MAEAWEEAFIKFVSNYKGTHIKVHYSAEVSQAHMWQSHVEIAYYYSIEYFDSITAFKVLYLRTCIKGGAPVWMQQLTVHALITVSPALNRSLEILRFEHSSAIKRRDEFYM